MQDKFPDARNEGYNIDSKPIFLLVRDSGKGGKESEVIVMTAKMHVVAERPAVNSRTGRRQVNLRVDSWRAEGHSKLLNTPIIMELAGREQKLDEDNESLRSTVVSRSSGADFPAYLTFNMAYTVSAPGLNFRTEGVLRSTASGIITEFPPPADAIFEIRGKDLTVGGIDLGSLACAC